MRCSKCNTAIKPVVALDIDGTLGDYHSHFISFAEAYLGVTGTHWAYTYDGTVRLAEHMGLTDFVYRQVKLAYRQGGGKRMMPLFDGARELTLTIRAAGAELWLTTTRPYNRYDSTDPDTRHWLNRHDLQWDHLIYDDFKYDRLREIVGDDRVVGVLEDIPLHYDTAENLRFKPWLRKTAFNRGVKRDHEVENLFEARSILLERVEEWYRNVG